MSKALQIAGLLAFLAVIPSANAADVSGTWKGSFDFQGTSVPLTFHLTATGDAVAGSVEGLPTTPAEIHDGKIEGDVVSFWVNTDYEGNTYKLLYKGKVSADGIKFSFGTEDGSWGTEVTATKEPEAFETSGLQSSAGE